MCQVVTVRNFFKIHIVAGKDETFFFFFFFFFYNVHCRFVVVVWTSIMAGDHHPRGGPAKLTDGVRRNVGY